MSNRPSRRVLLCGTANGFGGLALLDLIARTGQAATRPPHFPARAKSVIFLYMDGGPSQIDTFDPKPRLNRESGNQLPFKPPTTVFNITDRIYGSPFQFRRYGQSGLDVSELFPHIASCADDLAVIRSMVADHSEHTAANYFLHSGSGFQGRPSIGAWATYGLGSESENLPGFIVLDNGLIPPGGLDCFGSGFLPASYQATLFRPGPKPVADLEPREKSAEEQRAKLWLLGNLNRGVLERFQHFPEMEATIGNDELAYRMQTAVPELARLDGESELTRKMYGLDDDLTVEFGQSCLTARRLVERGVRFIEVLTPFRRGLDRWDQHASLEHGHRLNAKSVDQPIAALLKDLKSRGLLESTLVVWGGEFGGTPCAQLPDNGDSTKVGRDHNPFGFTMWLAGGGVKGGYIHGATDEYGYFAVEKKVHLHDLHATMLHLLELDHLRLTFRYSGRDMRLTDVFGNVVPELLA
ncbi:MAG: DUF1501 domain-containing protein [Acidobacteriota bacterium]